MKWLTSRIMLALNCLLLLVLLPVLLSCASAGQTSIQKTNTLVEITPDPAISQTPGQVTPGPVISRDKPAFSSVTYYPASNANNDNYDETWRSQGTPAWLAYDLSSVSASSRDKVLVVWYNPTYDYDHTVNGDKGYNVPQDYTIEVNAAPGGGQPPVNGWVVRERVKGNHYHSRQHVIDLNENNWIRMSVTAVDGSPENYDASLKMDIYAASYASADDWIFFGDSITAGAMAHSTIDAVKTFAQLINAKMPERYPVQEAGGIGYLKSADAVKYINTWLQLFPGKYVVLSYGTNDAIACIDATTFYNNYVLLVQAVLHAGKIPVVPHIPWGRNANIQSCGPPLNARIDALYKVFPQIIQGPDLWTYFQNNQTLISNDGIHPTYTGFATYRLLWAEAMLRVVYQLQ